MGSYGSHKHKPRREAGAVRFSTGAGKARSGCAFVRHHAHEHAAFGALRLKATLPLTLANSVWSTPMPTFVPGVHLGAALADEDVAGENRLAAEALHAQTLGVGIAAVTWYCRLLFYVP